METVQCKEHPEFDPYNESQFKQEKYYKCMTCCGLYYGTKHIGHYPGEHVTNKSDKANATTRLGPMNLEQFGHVRYSLGYDFRMSDGPSWCADEKSRTIYFDRKLDKPLQERLIKESGCEIIQRKWIEPKIVSMEKRENDLIVTFGVTKTETTLGLKAGMTVPAVRKELWRFMTELGNIPKENIVETAVGEK